MEQLPDLIFSIFFLAESVFLFFVLLSEQDKIHLSTYMLLWLWRSMLSANYLKLSNKCSGANVLYVYHKCRGVKALSCKNIELLILF